MQYITQYNPLVICVAYIILTIFKNFRYFADIFLVLKKFTKPNIKNKILHIYWYLINENFLYGNVCQKQRILFDR